MDFYLTNRSGHEMYRRMSIYQFKEMAAYAEAFKALSNPNRLAIFLHLLSCCPPGTSCSFEDEMKRCVGDLADGLNIGQPTISHHVKELRRAGLIHVEKKGKFTECWVDVETVTRVVNLLSGRFSKENECNECLPGAVCER